MNIRTNPIVRGLRCHWPKAVAILALGMSLGGTAYASGVLVPPASVGSVQLKRGAVTAPKLAANAITANSVNSCPARPSPMPRCSTVDPLTTSASAISRRWQRHHTASAHMIAVGVSRAAASRSASARWNSGVAM